MRFSRSTHLLLLSLETITSIIRAGLPILVELIDLVNCYNSSISNDLTQINFPTRIPECDSHSPATMAFPPLGNSDHVLVSVSIDFPSNSQRDVPFHRIAYDYSRADWDNLCNHLRDIHGRITLSSVLLLLLKNFVSGFRLELMYISLIENIKSSITHLHGFQVLVLLP